MEAALLQLSKLLAMHTGGARLLALGGSYKRRRGRSGKAGEEAEVAALYSNGGGKGGAVSISNNVDG